MSDDVELTVVMPCLNEADTVGICIEKAFRSMQQAGIHGEVVLADNGSTDNSKQIAESLGARTIARTVSLVPPPSGCHVAPSNSAM